MTQVAPSSAYSSRLVLGASRTGLTGTVRFRLLDNDATADDPVYGPSTASIVEDPTGTGIYLFRGTAPSTTGVYSGFWDLGAGTDLVADLDPLVVTNAPISPVDPGAAFASTADLEARLGITFTDAEETRAETLIALATSLIQQETGQHILLVEDDAITMNGRAESYLRLPQRPVQEVSAVSIAGQALVEGTDYIVQGDTLLRGLGWDRTLNAPWGLINQEVSVTYTHGFTTVPGTVRAVCIEMVARVWVNPGSVGQEMYGSVQIQHGNPGIGLMLTPAESKSVRDAVRRTAGTLATS